MELFLLFVHLGSKNFIEKIFIIFTKELNPILCTEGQILQIGIEIFDPISRPISLLGA